MEESSEAKFRNEKYNQTEESFLFLEDEDNDESEDENDVEISEDDFLEQEREETEAKNSFRYNELLQEAKMCEMGRNLEGALEKYMKAIQLYSGEQKLHQKIQFLYNKQLKSMLKKFDSREKESAAFKYKVIENEEEEEVDSDIEEKKEDKQEDFFLEEDSIVFV